MERQSTLVKASSRVSALVRRDARKSAILAGLLVVLLAMWARIGLRSDGPATAAAAPAGPSADVRVTSEPTPARSDNAGLLGWLDKPPGAVGRNLFWVKLDYYPRESGPIAAAVATPDGEGIWDRVEKSLVDQADLQKQRQVLVDNLQARARRLNLQGTMMGADPQALVNGTIVREGEVVAEFRVLRIEAQRIVVESQGVRLLVPMREGGR